MAYMAEHSRDLEFAKVLFTQIGQNWDTTLWPKREEFETAKRLVNDNIVWYYYSVATESAKSPEGKAFSTAVAEKVNQKYRQQILDCMKTSSAVVARIALLIKLGKDGAVQQILLSPYDAPEACFRAPLEKAAFTPPPKPDFWVAVSMDF